jgi:hypothetical protein
VEATGVQTMTRDARIDFDDVGHDAVKYSQSFPKQHCDETAQRLSA